MVRKKKRNTPINNAINNVKASTVVKLDINRNTIDDAKIKTKSPSEIQKTIAPEHIAHPADEFLKNTIKYYHEKDFDKALENANKAIKLGKEPNSIILSIIKLEIKNRDSIDEMSLDQKIGILQQAIEFDEYIEFLYPSSNTFFQTIFKTKPQSVLDNQLTVIKSKNIYDLNLIKNLRSFKTNYISEKPI